jgi:gas vesicle protein
MGEQVIPLEDDICKAANRYISTVQSEFSMLSQKLVNLELPGSEELQSICVMMGDLLSSDASGAPTKIGAEDSVLFAGIVRATSVQEAFNHGIGETIGELRKVIAEIESLPATGVPGKLREDTAEQISHLRSRLSSNGFHQHAPEYSSGLTQLKSAIAAATSELVAKQNESIQSAQQSLQNQPEWKELTNEEQAETLGQLDSHKIQPEPTLKGLKSLVNNEYSLSHQSTEMRSRVAELGKKRSVERLKQLRDKNEKLSTTISLKKKLSSLADIDATVSSLHAVRQKAESHPEFEIRIELDD